MSAKIDFNKSIKALSTDALSAKIKEDELRLNKITFSHALSPIENPMVIRSVRRDIARLKTELNSRIKA